MIYLLTLISSLLLTMPNNDVNKGEIIEYTQDDLIELSLFHWGFERADGLLNEYYGDIEHAGLDKESFYFNVGCGRGGDVISILLIKDEMDQELFYMYLKKGSMYYGQQTQENKPIGDLVVISDNEISGWIDLCLEEDASCCGEEGSTFVLKRLN